MKVTRWMLPRMDREALEEALKKCKPGSEMYRAIQAELETRPEGINKPSSIEDYL